LKWYFIPLSGFSEGCGFMKGVTMETEPWDNCNSLRYGFDESYDSPVFDDEDISEEGETAE
jgi:hypothetical protein